MISVLGTSVGLKDKRGIEPCAFAEGTNRHLSKGRKILLLLITGEFPRTPLLGSPVNKGWVRSAPGPLSLSTVPLSTQLGVFFDLVHTMHDPNNGRNLAH